MDRYFFLKIFLSVLIVHTCFILLHPSKKEIKEKKQKIIVKNITVLPVKTILPVQNTLPVKSQKAKKRPLAKKIKKKSTSHSQKLKKVAKKTQALNTLSEQIHNLDLSYTQEKKDSLEVPVLEQLKIDFSDQISTASEESLSSFFKKNLKLPEFGEIKIKLSTDHEGKVQKLEILQSNSKKNRAYLKNTLPELSFPCFNETLTIRFYNED